MEHISEFVKMVQYIHKNLNERDRRNLLALAASVYGAGGISYVHGITGVAESTLYRGKEEVSSVPSVDTRERVRAEGGGRKSFVEIHPEVRDILSGIIDEKTYGDPERVLHWTTMSVRKLSAILKDEHGLEVSHVTVGEILDGMGYSRQANRKNLQVGKESPDRDEQFRFICATSGEFLSAHDPVISVDTKKKELVGNFLNSGTEYRKRLEPRQVLDHDFVIKELGKVNPYGVYLLNDNTGFINLGTDHDTAEFAAESILRWWEIVGKVNFPNAKRIYINCDGGGSNGWRVHLWKYELQLLANITGLDILVSHFPPGTSKWNKIEHKLFCYISKNWQGQPLIDIPTIVNLISSTTTTSGLKVQCVVDRNVYLAGRKVDEDEFKRINIEHCEVLGQWNYWIRPQK